MPKAGGGRLTKVRKSRDHEIPGSNPRCHNLSHAAPSVDFEAELMEIDGERDHVYPFGELSAQRVGIGTGRPENTQSCTAKGRLDIA
jgi:hypothetical protein